MYKKCEAYMYEAFLPSVFVSNTTDAGNQDIFFRSRNLEINSFYLVLDLS
jgi:hypothetical protein